MVGTTAAVSGVVLPLFVGLGALWPSSSVVDTLHSQPSSLAELGASPVDRVSSPSQRTDIDPVSLRSTIYGSEKFPDHTRDHQLEIFENLSSDATCNAGHESSLAGVTVLLTVLALLAECVLLRLAVSVCRGRCRIPPFAVADNRSDATDVVDKSFLVPSGSDAHGHAEEMMPAAAVAAAKAAKAFAAADAVDFVAQGRRRLSSGGAKSHASHAAALKRRRASAPAAAHNKDDKLKDAVVASRSRRSTGGGAGPTCRTERPGDEHPSVLLDDVSDEEPQTASSSNTTYVPAEKASSMQVDSLEMSECDAEKIAMEAEQEMRDALEDSLTDYLPKPSSAADIVPPVFNGMREHEQQDKQVSPADVCADSTDGERESLLDATEQGEDEHAGSEEFDDIAELQAMLEEPWVANDPEAENGVIFEDEADENAYHKKRSLLLPRFIDAFRTLRSQSDAFSEGASGLLEDLEKCQAAQREAEGEAAYWQTLLKRWQAIADDESKSVAQVAGVQK